MRVLCYCKEKTMNSLIKMGTSQTKSPPLLLRSPTQELPPPLSLVDFVKSRVTLSRKSTRPSKARGCDFWTALRQLVPHWNPVVTDEVRTWLIVLFCLCLMKTSTAVQKPRGVSGTEALKEHFWVWGRIKVLSIFIYIYFYISECELLL